MKRIFALSTFLVLSTLSIAQQSRIELLANLTGAGKAKVVWKTRDQGNQLQAELESEGERMRANQTFKLTIGSRAWTVRTDGLGIFRLELRYIGASRPTIVKGMRAMLMDSRGAIVLSGVFQPK